MPDGKDTQAAQTHSAAAADPAAAPGNPRLLKELDVLHKAAALLHNISDAQALARDIIAILGGAMPHDFAAVYIVDGDRLIPFAVSDRGHGPGVLAADLAYLEALDLRVGCNVTGWVAAHGEGALLTDVHGDPRFLDSQDGVLSELCVPMKLDGQVTGVINLESTLEHAYDPEDQRLLEIVASQVAVAIDNARLLARSREFERLKILSELSGGVAHDLGNLLQVTAGHVELLLDPDIGHTPSQAQSQQVLAAMDKAITLTRGLLSIGRPSTSAAASEATDLADALQAIVPLLDVLTGSDVQLDIQPPSVPCRVNASTEELEQILMNLFVNARQAMPEGGTITLTTLHHVAGNGAADEPATVHLMIRDTGTGMDEATLARALEPYFTTRTDGTGLGLSTVARIVDDLGGRLDIDSGLGQGTSMTIVLPVASGE